MVLQFFLFFDSIIMKNFIEKKIWFFFHEVSKWMFQPRFEFEGLIPNLNVKRIFYLKLKKLYAN